MSDSGRSQAMWRLTCESCSSPLEPRSVWPWVRLAIGAFLAMNIMTFSLSVNVSEVTSRERMVLHAALLAATLLVGVVVGSRLVTNAVRELRQGKITIEALFLLGTGGAFAQSLVATIRGDGAVYYEVVAILLVVYALGRQLVSRSQDAAIEALNRERRETVCEVVNGVGATRSRRVSELEAGDVVIVKPGHAVPADGVILSGEASLRETPLTGEAFVRSKRPGDAVMAGTYPVDGLLNVRVTAPAAASEKARLLDEVGRSLESRAGIERAADRLARWFAPAVIGVASLTYAGWSVAADQATAVMHALSVLVVACPCALGFATPLAFWAAVRQLSALGLSARGGETVERLARVDCVVLDKTGTLTDSEACFLEELRHDSSSRVEESDLRLMLAAAERSSNHPIAAAFERLDEGAMNRFVVESLSILAGRGIRARLRDTRNQRTSTIAITNGQSGDNRLRQIEIAVDDRPAATAFIGERLHPVVSEAMEAFKRLGLRRLVATGDSLERAVQIPAEERHASLRPAEKTELVARLQRTGRRVLFVGDGLNDSGAMAVSDASIAVRRSAPLAAGVASAVLNHDDLAALPKAVEEARRALSVARTNLGFAASYNALGMTIAAAGVLHPVTAAILMTCSSLFVSWRSSRLLPEEEYVS